MTRKQKKEMIDAVYVVPELIGHRWGLNPVALREWGLKYNIRWQKLLSACADSKVSPASLIDHLVSDRAWPALSN